MRRLHNRRIRPGRDTCDIRRSGDHVLLPEIISKEPLGPLVRHGDNEWGDVVRWTLNALITAEELGVTSANIGEMSAAPSNPEINRLLGTEGTLGEMLGLDADWAKSASWQAATTAKSLTRTLVKTHQSVWHVA